MEIKFIILSLRTEEREILNNYNKKIIPEIKIVKSINGYDINETINELKKTNLNYYNLKFKTYGTLANFLTKYNILKFQIENKIPYLCFLEDDLKLKKNFKQYVINLVNEKYIKNKNKNKINMIRLFRWGEGYITSLNGAKNIIDLINKEGIVSNIDDQLRLLCGPEYRVPIWSRNNNNPSKPPAKLIHRENTGDCMKTKNFKNKEICKSLNIDQNLPSHPILNYNEYCNPVVNWVKDRDNYAPKYMLVKPCMYDCSKCKKNIVN